MSSNGTNGTEPVATNQILKVYEKTAADLMSDAWVALDVYNTGHANQCRRTGEDIFGRDEFTAMRGGAQSRAAAKKAAAEANAATIADIAAAKLAK